MVRLKIIVLLLCFFKTFSQNQNSFSYERSYYDNNDVISLTNDKFQISYTFKNKLTLFSNYSNAYVNLHNSLMDFNETDVENLYSLDIGMSKELNLSNKWSTKIMINPQLRNNSFKDLDSENFIFNASVLFYKKLKNNADINFGLEYGTLFGNLRLYPVFEYKKSINKKFSYTVGFPKSLISYNINNKNNLKFTANYSSYFTAINETNSRVIDNELLKYKTIFLSKFETSLEYNYAFYDESVISIRLGKSFGNTLEIKENNNEVSNYNFNNNFIISMGFKYNLNFK